MSNDTAMGVITHEMKEKFFITLDVEVFEWMYANGVFESPASAKYHGAFEGALFAHSYFVGLEFERLLKVYDEGSELRVDPYKVGFLHDICKLGGYKKSEYGYTYVPQEERPFPLYTGHGERSVAIATYLCDSLTDAEIACIRWHMGAYETDKWDEYGEAVKKYPEILLVHAADMIVSKVREL